MDKGLLILGGSKAFHNFADGFHRSQAIYFQLMSFFLIKLNRSDQQHVLCGGKPSLSHLCIKTVSPDSGSRLKCTLHHRKERTFITETFILCPLVHQHDAWPSRLPGQEKFCFGMYTRVWQELIVCKAHKRIDCFFYLS